LLRKQKHSPLPLITGLGCLIPQEQHGNPILQRSNSNTTGAPVAHSIGFSPSLQQHSCFKQMHSFMPAHPMTLAKSVEIILLQQQHAANTRSSLFEEKIEVIYFTKLK
jgi:hypothetical protein